MLVLLIVFAMLAPAARADGRHVVFVDNAAAEEGDGTCARPVRTLAAAQRFSRPNDVIYVAEGNAPYAGGLRLKRGQFLVGAAFGLDAVRAELKVELDATVPAVRGAGPAIAGTIAAEGDNVIAGCTLANNAATALVVDAPVGKVTVRDVWFRPSASGVALAVNAALFPVAITGGGMIGSAGGSGIFVSGGNGAVTIAHFPVSGEFGSVVWVSNRTGGTVKLGSGTLIKVADAARDAIRVSAAAGEVRFDDPMTIVTHGGRGLVIENSKKVVVAAGSKISTTNAAAVSIFNSTVDVVLEDASAAALPPGRLAEGIGINAMHGRFAVNGGTIRDAQAYGIRVEQSDAVKLANIEVIESGAVAGKLQCPEDLGAGADVVCRGGLFLRHVKGASFENIVVDGGSKNGLVANNVGDLTFRMLDLRRSGALLQELSGAVAFNVCKFADGGGVAIEQRFNRARVTFDHCTFAAPNQPQNSPFLLRARTNGMSALAIDLTFSEFHDNVGGAIEARAADTSTFSLSVADSVFQRLGATALDGRAEKGSRATVTMHGTRVSTPAVRDASVLLVAVDSATLCADLAGNELSSPARVEAPPCRP